MSNLKVGLDWITATRPLTDRDMLAKDEGYHDWAIKLVENAIAELGMIGATLKHVKNVGMGYEKTIELDGTGIRFMVPKPNRPEQGLGIVVSGGLRGVTHYTIANELLKKGWKFTRLDLAIDWRGGTLSWRDAVDEYLENANVEKRWSTAVYQGRTGGTLGIGSRQSNLYTRVYDKNAEQGLDDLEQWLRIEFEVKGKLCQNMARALILNPRASARALLERREFEKTRWGNQVIEKVGFAKTVEIPALGRKETDTERWMKHEVANALMGLAKRDLVAADSVLEYLKLCVEEVAGNRPDRAE